MYWYRKSMDFVSQAMDLGHQHIPILQLELGAFYLLHQCGII